MENSSFINEGKFITFGDLRECPICGCDTFYVNYHAEGRTIYRFYADGSEADNEDMYEALNFTGGKKVYCFQCNSYLGNCETNKISTKALNALLAKGEKSQNGK